MTTVLITGANRGIGLELCRQLAERSDRVIAACRTASEELNALGVEVLQAIDVTSDDVGMRLSSGLDELGVEEIDVLINNAGMLRRTGLFDLNLASIRNQFEVNALGPLKVTSGLIGYLASGGKVIIVTSRMGSIGDNTSGSLYGYRMSKAAVNMVGKSLSHDLRPQKVAVVLIHPGFVRTDMTGHQGSLDTTESVSQIIERIDSLTLENSGLFWHANGDVLPW